MELNCNNSSLNPPVPQIPRQECSKITSEILKESLYGKWYAWDGRPPSSEFQDAILKSLPPDLLRCTPCQLKFGISTLPGCSVGIFAREWIKDGTNMGPLPGCIIKNLLLEKQQDENDNGCVWEVFDEYGQVKHLLDGRGCWSTSWMAHVKYARNEQEQNLEVLQLGDIIYYKAIRNIPPDEELLVWYSNDTPQYMGLPEALLPKDGQSSTYRERRDGTSSKSHSTQPSSNGRLKCVVCRRGFNSRSNLRSHMRIHTMERPFICKFCQRSFSQSSTLRNHIRLHTGERPYKCFVCQSAYSQLAGLRAHQKSARHRPLTSSGHLAASPNNGVMPLAVPTNRATEEPPQ